MSETAYELKVLLSNGSTLAIKLPKGGCVFVLGANGTGKSALMHRFYLDHQNDARRITAHRQTWLNSNTLDLTASGRNTIEVTLRNSDRNADSRWKDYHSGSRPNVALYDIVNAENTRARKIAGAVDANDLYLATKLAEEDAPITLINELLRSSNIPIVVFVESNERVLARKDGGEPFSIAELSDGERNALLIAANVLTARANTLFLIDEPERHLHRSIISPLLTQLFAMRTDCAFVISTHDVMLPLDNPTAQTLLIRSCTVSGSWVQHWEADLVAPREDLDDNLKKDILGARRKMLFVEGADGSLDYPLYSLIFPEVSVIPKGGCRNVEYAVFALREANSFHWVEVWGIVDNDNRTEADLARLRKKDVHALSLRSVESIYYHPDIMRRMAKRHGDVIGGNGEQLFEIASNAALSCLPDHLHRLSKRVAEHTIRERVFECMPTCYDIDAGGDIYVVINVKQIVDDERARLENAVQARDLRKVVSRYPIRETPALDYIATKLGFQNRTQYESAVRKLLIDDKETLLFVRSLFGLLVSEMGMESAPVIVPGTRLAG